MMSMRPEPLLIVALALAAAPSVAQVEDVSIRTARDGEFVVVAATAVMRVDPTVAWAVLSDYDHLAKFIPDVKSSRILSRDGNKVRVEQKGVVGFWFYKEPVVVILEVHEEPHHRITARSVDGNVRGLETRYELQASGGGVRLDYAGRFVPEFAIPPVVGMPIVTG